jgi:signal transduction histidine kinase/CheY-like chemotaxis protein
MHMKEIYKIEHVQAIPQRRAANHLFKGRVGALVAILGVAAIYFIAARFGLTLAFVNASATAVWPPTGISLAAVLLLGRRIAPGIFLGAFLANLATAGTVATSLGIATGNTLEALIGAALVTRFASGLRSFDWTRDVVVFIIAAGIISTAVSATVGVTTLSLGGFAHWKDYWPIWITWWLGDAISAVVIAPLIIIWATNPLPRWGALRCLEAVGFSAVLLLVLQWRFLSTHDFPPAYLLIPLVMWAAFRFHQHGTATAVILISSVAIYGTLHGVGPFTGSNPNTLLLELQTLIGTLMLTGLVLSAVVTEREKINVSLQESRIKAEQANKAKDEFLAVLSHELRTPLTPVLLTVSLLESHPKLPRDIRKDIQTIRRNIELESRLIDDLLDLTRIEKRKLQFDYHNADVHELICAAADICRHNDSAPISLGLEASNHWVHGDSARLQQIFWNLISNAQKFTPCGGNITVRSADAANNRIKISVVDTGAGIEREIMPRIFLPFEQGDIRLKRQSGGLGLGLAITKYLVEAHGGTITASSEGNGKGAAFVVELPALAEPAPADAEPETAAPSKAKKALQILLLENHEPTSNVMAILLKGLGHRVITAATLAQADEIAQKQPFDILISDLGLPDGSGLDFMRRFRTQFAGRSIAFSGYGMAEDLQRSREAGFTTHLTKPVDFYRLQMTIEKIAAANNGN